MNTKKLNIFLAEDDEDDREFFNIALQKVTSNFELTVVNNGEKVKRFFNNVMDTLPDFVFLDINMPLLDGIECLKHIKKLHPENEFPIIMLSTAHSDMMVERSLENGATFYVQKPSRLNHLADLIRFCISEVKTSPVKDNVILQQQFIKHSALRA